MSDWQTRIQKPPPFVIDGQWFEACARGEPEALAQQQLVCEQIRRYMRLHPNWKTPDED